MKQHCWLKWMKLGATVKQVVAAAVFIFLHDNRLTGVVDCLLFYFEVESINLYFDEIQMKHSESNHCFGDNPVQDGH